MVVFQPWLKKIQMLPNDLDVLGWTQGMKMCIKPFGWGLPWWRSGWESTCQCRRHGFEPWFGKIPHAVEQLGPCAPTTGSML